MQQVNAVILAAGQGTRMKSEKHKVLHSIGGKAMIHHVLDSLSALDLKKSIMIVGAKREQVEAAVSGAEFVVQEPQLGTGHAVQCAEGALKGHQEPTFVLCGDVPLVKPETIAKMYHALMEGDNRPAVVVLGFRADDPKRYGRLKLGDNGDLDAIIEYKDASDDERAINLCNSGLMVFDGARLFDLLAALSNDNAAGEYYLTDAIAIAKSKGCRAVVVEAEDEFEVMGVNSRAELAVAENVFQNRKRQEAMADGVTLLDPSSVYFSYDTQLAADVVVEQNVVFGPNVKVAANAWVRAFSHLEGAQVGEGCEIGPFARLRPGAELHQSAKVGNFCEVKKSTIEQGAKVNHLTYIGDARVGAKANIGAGTITCNYDGFNKSKTDIGAGAFIGSNSSLVAPVKIGDGALVAAGSVITKEVEADALAIVRADQQSKQGWAAKFRAAQMKKKK